MIDWLLGRRRHAPRRERLVVYTAIFGDIPDRLLPPRRAPDPGVRWVCFTDRPGSFEGHGAWELRPPAWTHDDGRRAARHHKVLSHRLFPEADVAVWHDGNIRLTVDPWRIVDRHLAGHELAAFRHSQRGCVYEELEACLALGKDDPERMRAQVARYRAEGYPERRGLSETGMLVRRHTPRVAAFNEAWWREIEGGSVRDQLSFDVTLWRVGLEPATMPGTSRKSPYLKYTRHR